MRAVPAERLNAALSLGASRLQLFTSVILPSALPEILTGIRIAIAAGWGTLVAAELIAARSGVGYMIMSAANFLATDVVLRRPRRHRRLRLRLLGRPRSLERRPALAPAGGEPRF